MGGITGTAVMFAEACGHQLILDLDAVERPDDVHDEAWLTCFPSFGYLLAVNPKRSAALTQMVSRDSTLICCRIGHFAEGDCSVLLQQSGALHRFWDGGHALTGFGCVR